MTVNELFTHYPAMTQNTLPTASPQRLLYEIARLLLHLATAVAVAGAGYVLAVLALDLAERGGWAGVLGWTAFAAIVAGGLLLIRRCCCPRRRKVGRT